MVAKKVFIVSHTHWDREWYSAFQTFRMRLVDTIDGLLEIMEKRPSYSKFLLDGQTAVLDDYLEIRPENADRISSLAASGRLVIGPWHILMDEFLVSEETIVRNLIMGFNKASRFGGVMKVGYLPDMFGHIAQMPQILSQFGMEDAVVWRGVPSKVKSRAFEWRSLDGSSVRAEFLPDGYSNGSMLPDDAKALIRRIKSYEESTQDLHLDNSALLIMNGTDHQFPQGYLGEVVSEANAIQREYEIIISSLPEALEEIKKSDQGLTQIIGELRSGSRSNLLMGVVSNRVDIRESAANAERLIERYAEPLSALCLPAEDYPYAFLNLAWTKLIQNSAHDSICACSVDDVVDQVDIRYREVRQIGEGLKERALNKLASTMGENGTYVLNVGSFAGRFVTLLSVDSRDVNLEGTQVISQPLNSDADMTLNQSEVRLMLGQLNGNALGNDTFVRKVTMEADDEEIRVQIFVSNEVDPTFSADEAKAKVVSLMDTYPEAVVKVKLVSDNRAQILALSDELQPFEYKKFTGQTPYEKVEVLDKEAGVFSNGSLTVKIEGDGSLEINGVKGYNRYTDSGDQGDTYNYSPPANDKVVCEPNNVTFEFVETGPIRVVARIKSVYEIPERIDDLSSSRIGTSDLKIDTYLTLQAEEPFLRVKVIVDNHSKDHRIRALFPLNGQAKSSVAGTAFGQVERGLEAEGGPTERGLATYPATRFVRASDLTLITECVSEYELVDIDDKGANTLALTLLRATGMLSRVTMAYRPLGAGPAIPAGGAQLIKQVAFGYAITTLEVNPYECYEKLNLPPVSYVALGGGTLPASAELLSVKGGVLTSITRQRGGVSVRLFNPSNETVRIDVPQQQGYLTDPLGRVRDSFENFFEVGSFKFVTLFLPD